MRRNIRRICDIYNNTTPISESKTPYISRYKQTPYCGHVDKKNHPSQVTFLCTSCGRSLPADWNAAINIAKRGCDSWVVSHATERDTGEAA